MAGLAGSAAFRRQMNTLGTAEEQLAAINAFFDCLGRESTRLSYTEAEAEETDYSTNASNSREEALAA
jgi:hypothetical protein